ncbi:hypothetical protein VTJ49DRAFT_1151 [Mycothermus thermophilus]|uniref:Uncharacterized protein n=1 Tax=Humicola insolens TaxID=85995 RepID=A0ABR3VQW6_HUMIN
MDDYFPYTPEPFTPLEIVLTLQDSWVAGPETQQQRHDAVLSMLTGPAEPGGGCGLLIREAREVMLRAAAGILQLLLAAKVEPREVGQEAFDLIVWAYVYERVASNEKIATQTFPWKHETIAAIIDHLVNVNGNSPPAEAYRVFCVNMSRRRAVIASIARRTEVPRRGHKIQPLNTAAPSRHGKDSHQQENTSQVGEDALAAVPIDPTLERFGRMLEFSLTSVKFDASAYPRFGEREAYRKWFHELMTAFLGPEYYKT